MNNFLKTIGVVSAVLTCVMSLEYFSGFGVQIIFHFLFALAGSFSIYYVGVLREQREHDLKKFEALRKTVTALQEQITGIKPSVAEKEIERLQELKAESGY